MTVRIEGLRQFRRGLSIVDKALPKELRDRLRTDAAEPVARLARSLVPVRTGKTRRSIRAGGNARGAYVRGGGTTKTPHYGWLEFGGTIVHHGASHSHGASAGVGIAGVGGKVRVRHGGDRGTTESFGVHLIRRDRKADGRYLYPAARAKKEQTEEAGRKALDNVLRKAGLR